MSRVYRQLDSLRSLQEATNDSTDENEAQLVGALAGTVLRNGDILEFDESSNSSALFTAGSYPGFTVSSTQSIIRCQPGATIEGHVAVKGTCTFEGVHFRHLDNDNNSERLVTVEAGGVAIFRNCIFTRKYNDVSDLLPSLRLAHLVVNADGKAVVFSSTFTSDRADGVMNAAGLYAVSDAANPPTSLQVVASFNPTSHVISNGTETGVVT